MFQNFEPIDDPEQATVLRHIPNPATGECDETCPACRRIIDFCLVKLEDSMDVEELNRIWQLTA